MNPSSTIPSSSASSGLPRAVWVAGGLMAVAIAALAGTVVWQRSQISAAPTSEVATLPTTPATLLDDAASAPMAAAPAPVPQQAEVVEPAIKPVAAVKHATPKPAKPANAYPADTTTTKAEDYPVEAPPAPPAPVICATCGTIESVETVTVEGKGSGAGAVAGGVAGAVIGNQFGKGGGRTAARLLGAVGGAFAGNAIEKHARTETVYRMHVRMDDGSRRTITQPQPVSVGTAVTVDGNSMRVAQH